MKTITGLEIMDIIESLGEIEWGRCSAVSKSKNPNSPPFTVWRYKKRDPKLEALIVKAVESFQGNVGWEIEFTGKNWVIAPKRLKQFQMERGYQRDVESLKALAQEDPEFGILANADVPHLAEKIREIVRVFQF